VPFLSRIPIIGALFRQNIKKETRKDMLVMITPTIVNQAQSLGSMGSTETTFEDGSGVSAANASDGSNLESSEQNSMEQQQESVGNQSNIQQESTQESIGNQSDTEESLLNASEGDGV
jgi:type II secretory pathway component GspD/PulD (secretin)